MRPCVPVAKHIVNILYSSTFPFGSTKLPSINRITAHRKPVKIDIPLSILQLRCNLPVPHHQCYGFELVFNDPHRVLAALEPMQVPRQ